MLLCSPRPKNYTLLTRCRSVDRIKASRLEPMSWSVEWPSVSASRSHLGHAPKLWVDKTIPNHQELDISSPMKRSETENQKVWAIQFLIFIGTELNLFFSSVPLVSTWCWPQPSWISLARRSQTCTLDMHEISGNGEVKSPSTMAFGINSTPPRLQDTHYLSENLIETKTTQNSKSPNWECSFQDLSFFHFSFSVFHFRETMPIHVFAAQLRGPWKWPSPGPWMDLGTGEREFGKQANFAKSMFMQILLFGKFHENMVQRCLAFAWTLLWNRSQFVRSNIV